MRLFKHYLLPGLAFYLLAQAAMTISGGGGAVPVWPAAGIAFAAILLLGLRPLPGLMAAEVLVGLHVGLSPLDALLIASANAGSFAVGALLLRRSLAGRSFLDSTADMMRFLAAGPGLSAALSTLLGTSVLRTTPFWGGVPQEMLYWTWFVADMTAIVILAPLITAWARKEPGLPSRLKTAEGVGMTILGVLMTHFVFTSDLHKACAEYPLPFVFIPIMAWATFRSSHRTITLFLASIFLYGTAATLLGVGHFSLLDEPYALHILQVFAATAAITSLIIHVLVDSLKAKEQALMQINEEMEEHVADRTRHLNQALEDLKEAEASYRTIFENASEGIFRTDINTRFVKANAALAGMLGYPDPETMFREQAMANRLLIHQDDRARFYMELSSRGRVDNFEAEAQRKDGSRFWINLGCRPITDKDNRLVGTEGIIQDITERKVCELDLERRATRDPLTGIANRDFFEQSFATMLAQAKRSDTGFALLFLDMDGFKAVNDTLGHHAGDQVLVETVRRIRSRLREADLLARIGGDEFAILAHNARDPEAVLRLAGDILGALGEEFRVNNQPVPLAASIGGSLYPDHGQDTRTLLERADAAMYRAKKAGKNQARLWDGDGTDEAPES